MDETKAIEEMKKEEYEDFKNNAQLKAIIAGQKAKKMSVTISGIEIFIRAAIPKPLRDKIVKISKAYENGDIAEADDELYRVLANLCLEEPWNNPAAWKYVDEETGEVPNVIRQVMEKITDIEASAKNFRSK